APGRRRQALRGVSLPALVIHGDIDPLVPLAAGISTARSIPGAELMIVERMGHTMPAPLWPQMIDGIVRVAGRATTRPPASVQTRGGRSRPGGGGPPGRPRRAKAVPTAIVVAMPSLVRVVFRWRAGRR